MKARWHGVRLLVACAAALGWGCGEQEVAPADAATRAAAEAGPVRGDWLVLWLLSDPESLNPVTQNDASASAVLAWIFPSLMTLDNETLEQRPVIARELPEISADKLTYTFRLRENVTFSDGKPVTADDVVFGMKVIKHPEVLAPHTRNYYVSVRDAVAVDPLTVRFDLREPYFLNDLVLGGVSPLPRHHYDPEGLLEGISVAELESPDALDPTRRERAKRFAERFNQDFHRNPLGPGAFVLENPERDFVTGQRIVLRHRPDFWAPGNTVLGDAWVERVVFRIVNDQEAALVAFKGGELDRIGLTPIQHTREDTNNDRFVARAEKKVYVAPGYSYIGWNEKRPIFQDVRVRRALGHFVDKQRMIDKILLGLGEPVESPIFVRRPEYNRELVPYPFDPEKGKALLAEAGWADSDGDNVLDKELDGVRTPLRFEIISNSGNDIRKSVGLAVIDEFKRAGIDASLREIDWSIMLNKVKGFDYDAVVLGWAMSVTPPDAYQVFHSSQAVAGGSNHVFYRNAEVDRILEQYRVEFDAAKRKQLYDRFQRILYDEQPYTFLFMQKAITGWDRRFRGVVWYPSENTDMAEWWVPTPLQKYKN
jgi:peptide/nickel transport system substrate-binding protein